MEFSREVKVKGKRDGKEYTQNDPNANEERGHHGLAWQSTVQVALCFLTCKTVAAVSWADQVMGGKAVHTALGSWALELVWQEDIPRSSNGSVHSIAGRIGLLEFP